MELYNVHDETRIGSAKILSQKCHASAMFATGIRYGRVLNRFAKDIGSVDELLPKSLMDASQTMFIMLGSLVVGVTVNYWFIIPILLLGTVLLIMRSIYLRTSKNVKRVEGINLVTNKGQSIVRGTPETMRPQMRDVHSSAFYMFITTSSAFGFFIDFICFIYISLVTFSFLVLQDKASSLISLDQISA
uniref:ABC transmembrane type-1 domain-containing protein n=1 Tax=Timema poppense TaxID=170557 RepID=A0A7R9CNT0_TIMPO|nr:unnamed protein product [Timema poppensis]